MTPATQALRPVRHALPSGAIVIARRNPITPAVTFMLTFDAGSAFDPPARPGLAAFLARTIDRGMRTRSADEIADAIERRGASLDVQSNRQALTLTATCLAEDFDDVLALVCGLAREPAFPDEQIELRRRETLTRLAQDAENPGTRATAAFFSRLYGDGHPYAHHPRGTHASVEGITRADLLAFHAARVRPRLLTLAIVGDLDEAEAIGRASAALDGWRDSGAPVDRALPAPQPITRRVELAIPVPGKSQTDIAYGFLGPGRLDPAYYAFWVMNTVLGQYGMGGRLGENIRERQGMAYYAYSSFDAHRLPGPLLVRAGVDPSNVPRTLEAIDREVALMRESGITEEERANAVRFLVGSIPRLLETNAGIAQFLVTCEQFGLSVDFDRELPALLNAVTRDEASAAASSLDPSRAVVAIAGPETSGAAA